MRTTIFPAILLIGMFVVGVILPAFAADTLVPSDFQSESFSKTIDFYDYARAYANSVNMSGPPNKYHAYVYMTYVNTSGLQMVYAGLSNVTHDEASYLTIPMQSIIMHYKSENHSRDVLVSSNFLMLLAFNDTATSLYPNSPDMNDNLWSSFSMGADLSSFNATFPPLNSQTETIPLTHSNDKLQWYWGMKYTNLTAVWWETDINPANHTFSNKPRAITTYDELTFTYNLTLSPDLHTATLTENHVIGRMSNLWVFWGWFIVPLYNHCNSTGAYRYGSKISNETVFDFIQNNQIKMSIVDFQRCIVLDHDTYSTSDDGQNVTDTDSKVNNSITTYANDSERIFEASFSAKEAYKLFNPNETDYAVYNSTARTSRIGGFAEDTGLFVFHIGFMKLLPLVIAHMHPAMYQAAKDNIAEMSRANYLFIIAYPVYNGCRIEHDPTYTAYVTFTTIPEFPTGVVLPLLMIAAMIIILYTKRTSLWKPKTKILP